MRWVIRPVRRQRHDPRLMHQGGAAKNRHGGGAAGVCFPGGVVCSMMNRAWVLEGAHGGARRCACMYVMRAARGRRGGHAVRVGRSLERPAGTVACARCRVEAVDKCGLYGCAPDPIDDYCRCSSSCRDQAKLEL